jgi:hypothetical protein
MSKYFVLVGFAMLAAVGIPYASYSLSESSDPPAAPSTEEESSESSTSQRGLDLMGPNGPDSVPTLPAKPPIVALGDALRFDLTPPWIFRNWPHVTTGLGEIQFKGYRVPLVTGTGDDDLAGALTYYFDVRQQMQRITLHGVTGDPQKMLTFLSTRYGFTRRAVNDPGQLLYEAADPAGPVRSTLRLESARVVKASDAGRRFKVSLVLQRPTRQVSVAGGGS